MPSTTPEAQLQHLLDGRTFEDQTFSNLVREANLLECDLSDADFSGSDLSGSTIRGFTLARADFSSATNVFIEQRVVEQLELLAAAQQVEEWQAALPWAVALQVARPSPPMVELVSQRSRSPGVLRPGCRQGCSRQPSCSSVAAVVERKRNPRPCLHPTTRG